MDEIAVECDEGKGRVFCIIKEHDDNADKIRLLSTQLSSNGRIVVIRTPVVTQKNWSALTAQLQKIVSSLARQVSLIAFESVTALTQALSLSDPKLVRTLILINPTCRSHPNFFTRVLDAVEKFLPLGLPLRLSLGSFDSRAELHRIRCPVLICLIEKENEYLVQQALTIAHGTPTAWLVEPVTIQEMADVIERFQEVPAKFPMKNIPTTKLPTLVQGPL